jgi:sulfite exporter TauE/SafE
MNGKQFLEMLARLPTRVWLQAIVGLIGFVVLAVLGFAVIAGIAAVVLLLILGFKAKAWLLGLFQAKPPAPRNAPKVIDVPYEIVERKDEEKR